MELGKETEKRRSRRNIYNVTMNKTKIIIASLKAVSLIIIILGMTYMALTTKSQDCHCHNGIIE